MKRYWKLISLFIVVLLTFSIYYVHGALAKEELLELELVTITDKGDLQEDITIHGQFENGSKYLEKFTLTSEGMTHDSELGYFERLNSFYYNSTLEKLTKDYRGFMRGKAEVELFYEDENQLVYVGPYGQEKGKNRFEVEILDKATKDKKDFSVKIPHDDMFEYMTILEVQVVGGIVHVFTTNYYREGEQIHVYKIDISEEKIIDNEPIESISTNSYISNLNDYKDISKKPYIVFEIEKMKWDEETGEGEVISQELKSYHVETGELQTIDSPEAWSLDDETTDIEEDPFSTKDYIITEEYLYFIYILADAIEVIPYHLEKNELEAAKHLPLEQSVVEDVVGVFSEGEHFTFISEGQENDSRVRKLFMIDLQNNEIVYEGEIKITNAAREMLIYEMYFYDVFID